MQPLAHLCMHAMHRALVGTMLRTSNMCLHLQHRHDAVTSCCATSAESASPPIPLSRRDLLSCSAVTAFTALSKHTVFRNRCTGLEQKLVGGMWVGAFFVLFGVSCSLVLCCCAFCCGSCRAWRCCRNKHAGVPMSIQSPAFDFDDFDPCVGYCTISCFETLWRRIVK